jgi:NADPH:quinone reductase
MSLTARKWVAVDFGGPEVLRNIEVDVPDPGPGQVTIDVRAAGMNPADAKHIAPGQDRALLPLSVGYEVAGVVRAFGPDTELASGGGAVGDQVVAAMVDGGYTTAITVPASDVFAKPTTLSFPEAANLLLVGITAADLLHTSGAKKGETVLLHGAAGAVGVSVLQQARLLGVRVVGTASRSASLLALPADTPWPAASSCTRQGSASATAVMDSNSARGRPSSPWRRRFTAASS